MKYTKTLHLLTLLIIILSGIATTIGMFSNSPKELSPVLTSFGETIELYGKGIYARDSVSMASQAIAQDFITCIGGIPLLIIGLCLALKQSKKGVFLLSGTLAYFLYTYASYSLLIVYNHLYLIYVAIMILSFYAFILCMNQISHYEVETTFACSFPIKAVSRFLWATGFMLGSMWIGRVIPTLTNESAPEGLEVYSTLGIQTLDLGFVVPACFIFGYLLRKKNKWGYLLSIVLVAKALTITAAVSAMTILMRINGIFVSPVETFLFPTLFIICVIVIVPLFRKIKE